MTQKLLQIFAGAAALVALGAPVGVAIVNALDAQSFTCEQYSRAIGQEYDPSKVRTYYIALKDIPTPIPSAHDGRLMGMCGGGVCDVDACGVKLSYSYEITGTLGEWKLAKLRSHPYFAKAWRGWAEDRAETHFLGSPAEVKDRCLSRFTSQQCLSFLSSASACWDLGSESQCRNGRLYGPGEGGKNPCDPALYDGAKPIPCSCAGDGDCWKKERDEPLGE